MRALIVMPRRVQRLQARYLQETVVAVGRSRVRFALIETEDTEFDQEEKWNREYVLVRVKGFSLNYRDRALIRDLAATGRIMAVGSEFVGEVVATGRSVTRFRVGDRVIGQMAWPGHGIPNVMGGIPTNSASRELQAFHETKLVTVPSGMSSEIAAGFALGAQTAYGMLRRLKLVEGERVLVTAATSNTSLFTIHALRRWNVRVAAVTSTSGVSGRLRELGVGTVLELESRHRFRSVLAAARRDGTFDVVIDPFADVYLPRILGAMTFFGRYITCGVAAQGPRVSGTTSLTRPDAIGALIVKNLTIMGNCLGLKEDLNAALADWSKGCFDVTVDSVHTDDVGRFLNRTFNEPDRFGKVIYLYA